MKILILGSQGNLGSQLVKVFEPGNDVIAWDRSEVDITDKELLQKKINEIRPGVIINAIAYNAVDKCESDDKEGELAEKINVKAVGYLAEEALAIGATIVHYSSDYVFGGRKKDGYKEDGEPRPINKYGKTKLGGEKEIIRLSGKGLKWYLIRTSKLFGPKGESEYSKLSFFDVMLKLAKEKNELDIVDEEISCFTYTPDLARATRDLVESDAGYGIYHIVNSGPCTWYNATKDLFDLAGIKIKINAVTGDNFPRPAKRPKNSVLLSTKIKPLRNWREALREYLEILA